MNTKLILWICILILLIGTVNAKQLIVIGNNGSTSDTLWGNGGGGLGTVKTEFAQRFNLTSNALVDLIKINLTTATGTPAGNYNVSIHYDNGSGGAPNGTLVLGSISYTHNSSDLSPPGLILWNFNATFSLNSFTQYWIVLTTDDIQGVVDRGERIVINQNVYLDGKLVKRDDLGTWTNYADDTYDLSFLLINETFIDISDPFPTNNTQYDSNLIIFNATGNFSSITTCSLILNETNNETKLYSNGTTLLINFTKELIESQWTYKFSCNNSAGEINSSEKIFYTDVTDPIISSNFTNNSLFMLDNVSFQLNLSDNLIISSYNISLAGVNIEGNVSVGRAFLSINFSQNVSALSIGKYNLTIRLADGHTKAELIRDYDFKNGIFNDYSEYSFIEGGYIKTYNKDKSMFDDWNSTRYKDKYTQIYTPSNPSSTITFVEESDLPIKIIEKAGSYKGQWIIFGDHWKDYVLKNEPNSKVSIKRINDYKVEVTISEIKNTNELEFESIGDLNIVTTNYFFYKNDYTLNYNSLVLELETQNINLTLNKTQGTQITNAVLFYNNVAQTVSKTTFSDYDVYVSLFPTPDQSSLLQTNNITWSYSLTSVVNTETGNISVTQSSSALSITYCGNQTNTSIINFTVLNEYDDSLVLSTINLLFDIGSGVTAQTLGINFTNTNNFSACIFPNWASTTGDMEAQYYADGFDPRNYYLNSYLFDNQTDLINLYLSPFSNNTEITVTVVDEFDQGLDSYFVKCYRYDLAANNFSLVDVQRTTVEGNVKFALDVTTDEYRFDVENSNGEIIGTRSRERLIDTTYTIRIVLGQIITPIIADLYSLDYSLTANPLTDQFTLTWSDTNNLIDRMTLEVNKMNVTALTLLHNASSILTAGTLTYSITTSEYGTFAATAKMVSSVDGKTYTLDSVTIDKKEALDVFGLETVMMTFIFVGTIVFMGLALSAPVALVLLAFGLFIFQVLGFFSLTTSSLIAIICTIIIIAIVIYRRN